MAPPEFSGWNVLDDDDEDEVQQQYHGGTKDTVLFCIDAGTSMQTLHDIENDDGETVSKSNLQGALEAALKISKSKIVSGPSDLVGIMLFNTEAKSEEADLRNHTYLLQKIAPLSVSTIQELSNIVQDAIDDPESLRNSYPPYSKHAPTGDVFQSCNWILRDQAAKTGTKRVFLITDEDNPHPNTKLWEMAQTNLEDLRQLGVEVLPFFINREGQQFDISKFWASVLQRPESAEKDVAPTVPDVVSGFDDLVTKLSVRESAKRATCSIPFHLGKGFTIGIKGYGLVVQQRTPVARKMANRGESYEEVISHTVYEDSEMSRDVRPKDVVLGMALGPNDQDTETGRRLGHVRVTAVKSRVYFTKEEVKQFRTLGFEPGLKLLGFKDRSELRFEDNIKHSHFLYPNEEPFPGSTRTFTALLQVLLDKNRVGVVVGVLRANSAPAFYALLPQAEVLDDAGAQVVPPGFHLIVYPFADEIRSAGVTEAYAASDELKDAARAWINKLTVKSGYDPKKFPNPDIKFRYEQLQALAFGDSYEPEEFEDPSLPPYDVIHKRAGALLTEWKQALEEDPSADKVTVTATSATKRKAGASAAGEIAEKEIRTRESTGTLEKLTNDQLKTFLKSKALPVSGKKADLVDRIQTWIEENPA
ncbi:Ku DNA-binding complex, Ku70 subunit [Auriculariales sp. MPI-PUGE-AT-0066]|nr:Ku DNA-binding complex, Ku70 subunit [Auriculariales sp. MPI-PUGE-AT-0066]